MIAFIRLAPPPKEAIFWSCLFVCLSFCLSVSRIERICTELHKRCASSRKTRPLYFVDDPDYDPDSIHNDYGGGLQSLTDCLDHNMCLKPHSFHFFLVHKNFIGFQEIKSWALCNQIYVDLGLSAGICEPEFYPRTPAACVTARWAARTPRLPSLVDPGSARDRPGGQPRGPVKQRGRWPLT